jgi:hypothetical protein
VEDDQMPRFRSLSDGSRRDFLKFAAAGASFASLSGWLDVLAARAATAGARPHKSCILLWMEGGASHKDTFDLKPGTANGGEFRPIATSVPGLEISEHLPRIASQMHHAALVRGMSTNQGAHGPARYFMHTGYREGSGGVVHPSLGSIVSAELGEGDFALPNFVSVGGKNGFGAGFLGVRHQPLIVDDPTKGVENLSPMVAEPRFARRYGLLEELETGFLRTGRTDIGSDHNTTYQRTLSLMHSKEARAFDLASEPEASRRAYGEGDFAKGCLLARRLVEVGVPYVEVVSPGWDTHQDNFYRVKKLSGQFDAPIAALVADLESRGLLESTLIIWMGEFGRTPQITAKAGPAGRGHYPRAWSTVLFGGGVPGGRVVGKTDKVGAEVIERPVAALDFLATVCTILGIDHTKQNDTPIGRPIRIVDKGATPVSELLG